MPSISKARTRPRSAAGCLFLDKCPAALIAVPHQETDHAYPPDHAAAHHAGTVVRILLRRFLPFLRPYRPQAFLTLALVLTRPALNAAKVWLLKIVIDDIVRPHDLRLLPAVCAAYLAITAVKGLLGYASGTLTAWLGGRITNDIRQRLYTHLHALPLAVSGRWRPGDLLTRLTTDTAAMEGLLTTTLSEGTGAALTIVAFVGILLYLDPRLALSALLIIPILAVAIGRYTRRSRETARAVRQEVSALAGLAEEALGALPLVKAFGRADHERERFAGQSQRNFQARQRAARVGARFQPTSEIVATIGTVLVLWVGVHELFAGRITLGGLVVFLGYLGSLYTPLVSLSQLSGTMQTALAGAERVVELLDLAPESPDAPGARPLPPLRGAVRFERVTYGYDAGRPVLRDVSLSIQPGELIALVGPSGAGKSTLLSLLLRFADPDRGRVLLDGRDIREATLASLRAQVALVPQDPLIVRGTVADTIRYGRLDADDVAVAAAAEAAGAAGFIAALPEGYATEVGPRGARLSGGQRQRLAIARALVRDAPLLLLDEATAALDTLAEARLRETLDRLAAGRTTLLVAHRLSTARWADRIVVLDGGRIVEEGTHEELLARSGLYARLYHAQFAARAPVTDGLGSAGAVGGAMSASARRG